MWSLFGCMVRTRLPLSLPVFGLGVLVTLIIEFVSPKDLRQLRVWDKLFSIALIVFLRFSF